MPTYEYRCEACGAELELFQSMSEAPKRKCPECGKQRLKRKIGSGAGIIFKGSGFYQTDYRSESYKKAAAAETGGGEKAASGEKPAGEKAAGDSGAKKADAGPAKKGKKGSD